MTVSDADQLAITNLVSRYNFAMDHLDSAGWADTFTEDGAMVINGTTVGQGRQGLIAVVEGRRSLPPVRHWVTNFVITGDTSKARLKLYVMAITVTADGSIAPYVLGEYDDELVSVGGQWKFKVRHMSVVAGKSLAIK
jgi:hypothetical protein